MRSKAAGSLAAIALVLMLMLTGCAANDGQMDEGWTVEELGEIIVAAGTFWEEWWGTYVIGRFAPEHVDFLAAVPEGLPGAIYRPLLPSSGFGSLNDIRNYLLQFYTERWVDAVLDGDFAPFIEYEGVLYIHNARAGFSRPNWSTAEHIIVGQGGDNVVVETTLQHGSWHRLYFGGDAHAVEVTYRFELANGRIDKIDGWGIFGP